MLRKLLLPIGLLICCGSALTATNSGARHADRVGPQVVTDAVADTDTVMVKLAITGMTCGS